jgi:hypothetical protein
MKVQAGAYAVRSTRKRKCRIYTSTKGGYFVANTTENILSLLPLLDEQIADELDKKNQKASITEQARKMLVNLGNSDVYIIDAEIDRLIYDLFPIEDEIALVWGRHE